MNKRLIRLAALPLIVVSVAVGAEALTFRAETLDVPGSPGCVQVGLFLNDPMMPQSWQGLVATLDYSADMGVLVAGVPPEARLSSFGSMPMPEDGLTDPATLQPAHGGMMTMCQMAATTNSVVLGGGMDIPFMPSTNKEPVMLREVVNNMMGRITLEAQGDIQTLQGVAVGGIQTLQGMDQLFAILTFPVTGSRGAIQINFSMVAGSNGLIDSNMMTVMADTTGGAVRVGQGSAIPTLAEWGAIVFLAGIVLSTLFVLRRRFIPS